MTFAHTLETRAPKKIWQRWTEVETWHEWDTEIKQASLQDNFKLGARGSLVPKTGPRSSFTVTELTPQKRYTFVTNLPLCKLHVKRYLSEDGGTFTHEVRFTGLLAPLFGRLLGERFQKVLPEVMENLRERAEPKSIMSAARSGGDSYE